MSVESSVDLVVVLGIGAGKVLWGRSPRSVNRDIFVVQWYLSIWWADLFTICISYVALCPIWTLGGLSTTTLMTIPFCEACVAIWFITLNAYTLIVPAWATSAQESLPFFCQAACFCVGAVRIVEWIRPPVFRLKMIFIAGLCVYLRQPISLNNLHECATFDQSSW